MHNLYNYLLGECFFIKKLKLIAQEYLFIYYYYKNVKKKVKTLTTGLPLGFKIWKSETAKSQKLEVTVYSKRRKSFKFWKSQGKNRSQ